MDTREGEREGVLLKLVFFIGKTSELLTFVEHLNRILGSSLIANFSAYHEWPTKGSRGTGSPVRFLQGVLVILARLHILQLVFFLKK